MANRTLKNGKNETRLRIFFSGPVSLDIFSDAFYGIYVTTLLPVIESLLHSLA